MARDFLRTVIFITMSFLPFLTSCKKEAVKNERPKAFLISIDKKQAELVMYGELRLEATVYPKDHKFTVNWKSEDEKIATVDAEGVVRGVSLGTVKIKASVDGLAEAAECEVSIKKAYVSIDIASGLMINLNEKYSFSPSFSPPIGGLQLRWSSDNEDVVSVDSHGNITAKRPGEATILVELAESFYEEASAECKVLVLGHDYIDNNINYGKGIKIGSEIWAPVNCGYEASINSDKGYIYGKYYQWGRKAGHGYVSLDGHQYNKTIPVTLSGPVNRTTAADYWDRFITIAANHKDWLIESDFKRWNSGTDGSPEKTKDDPCPKGWRLPTFTELNRFVDRCTDVYREVHEGVYQFKCSFPDGVVIYLPAGGDLQPSSSRGIGLFEYGRYWASYAVYDSSINKNVAKHLKISHGKIDIAESEVAMGFLVRCVHE